MANEIHPVYGGLARLYDLPNRPKGTWCVRGAEVPVSHVEDLILQGRDVEILDEIPSIDIKVVREIARIYVERKRAAGDPLPHPAFAVPMGEYFYALGERTGGKLAVVED